MAVTVAKPAGVHDIVMGSRRVVTRDITFDDSYPDDGEALTPADVGLEVIVYAPPAIAKDTGNDAGVLVTYDITNSKLLVLWGNAGTASVLPEPAATTDLAAYSARMRFEGR